MKPIKILFIATFLAHSLFAGDEVGGGGIAENNILYAFENLDGYIDICLTTPTCSLSQAERQVLNRIRKALPEERKNKQLIQFESESNKPGFFYVDGHVRIAKTGFKVGSPIYFNRDLLYPNIAQVAGGPSIPIPNRPYDIPFATSILVHELGHHQGERDHTYLDALGSKLTSLMQTYSAELDGGPFQRSLIVTALNYMTPHKGPEILLRDTEKLYAIGDKVEEALQCPENVKMHYFQVWNLHWLRGKEAEDSKDAVRRVRMRTVLQCMSDTQVLLELQKDLEIQFETVAGTNPNDTLIKKDSLKIRQIDCVKTPSLCH